MSLSGYDYSGRSIVADASLHPPIHGQGPVPTPASLLLDFRAYIDGRTNATTAWSNTRGGDRISVTFWPAHPPRVSHFSVFCPDLNPSDFAEEPHIMAAEDDVVLLCVVLGPITDRDSFNYFVYQAGGCMPSSLKLLNHPGRSRIFHFRNVGLLRSKGGDGFYVIAALCYTSMVPGHHDLYTYDSRTEEWATKLALMRQEQELGHHSSHCHTKVITLGGKAGTMGWVDLWRGILFCDVLRHQDDHTVPLCYVALPPPLQPDRNMQGGPGAARDIAVVSGRIKYVELQIHVRPGSVAVGEFISDDWTAATWSRKATSVKYLEKAGSWQPGCKVRASQISARKKPAQFELLPKLVDDQGTPQPTLERLHTAHPKLSLHQDNVVYFMTKVHFIKGTKAWVLAVDVKNKTLQGVAESDARRTLGMNFIYMCSSISQHLHMSPATHGQLKRPGMLMWRASLKKQAGINGQKNQECEAEGTSLRALDQDNMDLDK
ncbi:unnamed protein product [Urochloa decumbens]|uniref:DUF1618 domain-containing protein n=1 Tax=Urochloa decumbens TaxID=240449 RepID=A0ABC9DLQ7_9POAL